MCLVTVAYILGLGLGWKRQPVPSLTHKGHSTTYSMSTYVTLMVIKDRPAKPPAMLVKEL